MTPTLHPPVYRLHVELDGIEPPIWRLLEVPGSATLRRLHDVLQRVMGWQDSHMHLFEIGEDRYGFGDNEFDEDEQDDSRVRLGDVVAGRGVVFTYTYDFGDNWVHRLEVESVVRDIPRGHAPRLVAGARACPPEDCGSANGYYDLIDILADPEHEEHAAMRQWLGRPYHPDAFDVAAHDRRLQRYRRAPRGPAGRGRQPVILLGATLALLDGFSTQPGLPQPINDLAARLLNAFAASRPDEFTRPNRSELWAAAAVHAAFMLYPRALLYPARRMTLAELAGLAGASTASISNRSRQLREMAHGPSPPYVYGRF